MADSKGNNKEKLLFCSFCGKNQNEVRKLIAGPSVYICNECVDLCNDIIQEEINETAEEVEEESLLVPKDIKAILDDYVIGQEEAKKNLSVAVYNHYKYQGPNQTLPERMHYEHEKRAADWRQFKIKRAPQEYWGIEKVVEDIWKKVFA